jgi:dimethylaniline monooxygenase (N-oxide forming)
MDHYLVSYAKNFGLLPRARLNTIVYHAHWSEKEQKWQVETSTDGGPRNMEEFDKVVYSMGPDQIPNIPNVPGMQRFGGDATHSIAFKK